MNEMTVVGNQEVVGLNQGLQRQNSDQMMRHSVYDEQRVGKMIDEMIAGHKDDRINTKRAISGSNASTAHVQNQNERVIELCERELRRRDLSQERRANLLAMAQQAAENSAEADSQNRAFVREEIKHLHRSNWLLIGSLMIVLGGEILLSVA